MILTKSNLLEEWVYFSLLVIVYPWWLSVQEMNQTLEAKITEEHWLTPYSGFGLVSFWIQAIWPLNSTAHSELGSPKTTNNSSTDMLTDKSDLGNSFLRWFWCVKLTVNRTEYIFLNFCARIIASLLGNGYFKPIWKLQYYSSECLGWLSNTIPSKT